jgi:hypothetical protein
MEVDGVGGRQPTTGLGKVRVGERLFIYCVTARER